MKRLIDRGPTGKAVGWVIRLTYVTSGHPWVTTTQLDRPWRVVVPAIVREARWRGRTVPGGVVGGPETVEIPNMAGRAREMLRGHR